MDVQTMKVQQKNVPRQRFFFLPLAGSVAILAEERQARLVLQLEGCLHGLGQLLLLLGQSTGDLWISARSDFLQNVLYMAATASHHHRGLLLILRMLNSPVVVLEVG